MTGCQIELFKTSLLLTYVACRGMQEAADCAAASAASDNEAASGVRGNTGTKSKKLRRELRALATRLLEEQESSAALLEGANVHT